MEKGLSKEEILKANYEKVFGSPKYENSVNKEMNQLYILPAMTDYADQQSKKEAIAFAEWMRSNEYVSSHIVGKWAKWQTDWVANSKTGHQQKGMCFYTTEELYQLYSSQSKQ